MNTYYNGTHWVAVDPKSNVVITLAGTLKELQNKLKALANS